MKPKETEKESGHPEIRSGSYNPRATTSFGGQQVQDQGGHPELRSNYGSDSYGSYDSATRVNGY